MSPPDFKRLEQTNLLDLHISGAELNVVNDDKIKTRTMHRVSNLHGHLFMDPFWRKYHQTFPNFCGCQMA